MSINQLVADMKKVNANAGEEFKETEKWEGKCFLAFKIGKSHLAVTALCKRLVTHGYSIALQVRPEADIFRGR
ncbi:hypothetical protein JOD24_000692 [Kroppenstedtia sanguinis]